MVSEQKMEGQMSKAEGGEWNSKGEEQVGNILKVARRRYMNVF